MGSKGFKRSKGPLSRGPDIRYNISPCGKFGGTAPVRGVQSEESNVRRKNEEIIQCFTGHDFENPGKMGYSGSIPEEDSNSFLNPPS